MTTPHQENRRSIMPMRGTHTQRFIYHFLLPPLQANQTQLHRHARHMGVPRPPHLDQARQTHRRHIGRSGRILRLPLRPPSGGPLSRPYHNTRTRSRPAPPRVFRNSPNLLDSRTTTGPRDPGTEIEGERAGSNGGSAGRWQLADFFRAFLSLWDLACAIST